jgi:hypothetical protein
MLQVRRDDSSQDAADHLSRRNFTRELDPANPRPPLLQAADGEPMDGSGSKLGLWRQVMWL